MATVMALLYSFTLAGQQLPYRHFGVKEGLPHPELYALCKGPDNTLWISTDNGLSHYDGASFKNFNPKNITGSSFVLSTVSLPDGRMLVNTYRGGLCFWEAGRLVKAVLKVDSMQGMDISGNLVAQLHSLIYDTVNRSVWAISAAKSLLRLTVKGNLITLKQLWRQTSYYAVYPDTVAGQTWIGSKLGLHRYGNGDLQPPLPRAGKKAITKVAALDANTLLLAGPNSLLRYQPKADQVVGEIQLAGNSLHYEGFLYDRAHQLIWVPDENGGVKVYGFYGNNPLKFQLLPDVNVNYLFADDLNNVWCCSYGSGLFQFSQFSIVNYGVGDGLKDNYVTNIGNAGKGRLSLSCLKSYHLFDTATSRFGHLLDVGMRNPYNNQITWPNGGSLFLRAAQIIDQQGQRLFDARAVVYDIAFLGNDTLLVGANKQFYMLNRQYRPLQHSFQLPGYINYHKFVVMGDSILVATSNGVYMRLNGRWYHVNESNGLPDNNVYDIEVRGGHIYCATRSGIATIDAQGNVGSYDKVKTESWIVQGLCRDDRGGLWFATDNGLYLDVNGNVYLFNQDDGLVANDVNCLFALGDRLYAGTTQGLSMIDLASLYQTGFKQQPCLLTVLAAAVNGVDRKPLRNGLTLAADENEIAVNIVGPDYFLPSQRILEYSMDGGATWAPIVERQLTLRSLGYGSYRLQVRTKLRNGQRFEMLADYAFVIRVPWYRNVFFISGVVLLVMVAVGLWFLRYFRKRNREAVQQLQAKQQVLDLKQKAMAALLNPHFVFNSINSINYYIHKGEEETYTRLLTDLSRLIRLNLNNTYQDSVTLASELEIIELYVQFEKHRFIRQPLEFAIEYNSQAPPTAIKIPSMMLQPFVENAIWHGVLPRQGGEVVLAVNDGPEGYIQITIKDDGAGCHPQKAIRSERGGVRGIGLIQERIAAYNSLHKKKIKLGFENTPQGFSVALLFPVK
jgi:ligand-binding sensor domain-containing protein/two-component sensor histidine kinase